MFFDISPAITAANAVAHVVNNWNDGTLPTAQVLLTPVIDASTGNETIPALYIVPAVRHQIRRADRAHLENTVDVALVLIDNTPTEAEAKLDLNLVYDATRCILATGRHESVAFVSADVAEAYDYELLAETRIFRSQVNITCKVFTTESATPVNTTTTTGDTP